MFTLDRQLFLLLNADEDAQEWVIDSGYFFAEHAHWLLLPLALAALCRWRPLVRPALAALIAIALSSIASELIGVAWDRPRPFEIGLGFRHLDHSPSPSFPSSHAAAYAALAFSFLIAPRCRWAGALLLLLATLVGVSRVVVGVHYPLDVLIGSSVGAVAAWAALWLVDRFWTTGRALSRT